MNSAEIEAEHSRIYILKRIMEYGDVKAVSWMLDNCTKDEMCEVLYTYRGLSRKSAKFRGPILDVSEEKIVYLNRRLNGMVQTAWPF